MGIERYDYAIIGAGAAGLQLALKMIDDPFFNERKILIIEPSSKTTNDRTWCFWEKGETLWDKLATHTWGNGTFYGLNKTIHFGLEPYRYKMVRSKDFYAYALNKLTQAQNVTWVQDSVLTTENEDIRTEQANYKAKHIFDSRIPFEFEEKKSSYHSPSAALQRLVHQNSWASF